MGLSGLGLGSNSYGLGFLGLRGLKAYMLQGSRFHGLGFGLGLRNLGPLGDVVVTFGFIGLVVGSLG